MFPLKPGGKEQLTAHGHLDATTDSDQIQAWWTRWPEANIGVDLEQSGLLSVAPKSTQWSTEFERRGLPATWSSRGAARAIGTISTGALRPLRVRGDA